MRKFVLGNHSYKDKNPIVNKFSYLLLWGFLFVTIFTVHNPGLPQLTGQDDYLNHTNGITSTQTSTGNGYTMYNPDVKSIPQLSWMITEEGFKFELSGLR